MSGGPGAKRAIDSEGGSADVPSAKRPRGTDGGDAGSGGGAVEAARRRQRGGGSAAEAAVDMVASSAATPAAAASNHFGHFLCDIVAVIIFTSFFVPILDAVLRR
jgi:hypothetical protein